jgi:hypothetical protein
MLMRSALFWGVTRRWVVVLYLPIFKGQEVQDFLTLEDETDTLSRNVGKGLPLDAA